MILICIIMFVLVQYLTSSTFGYGGIINYTAYIKPVYIKKRVHTKDINISSKSENSHCKIPKYDVWTKNIFKYINPVRKEIQCNVTYENKYYDLKDGVLSLKKNIGEETKCFYICEYPKNDRELISGKETKITNPVILDCDIFYFKCKNSTDHIIFDDFSFHIRAIPELKVEPFDFLNPNYSMPKNVKKYDVNMYVIDSLSHFHAIRTLENTRNYLINDLEGIEMNFLNIQAENSRPNAYGFLLNKQSLDIVDIFGAKSTLVRDYAPEDMCKVKLDRKTYIMDYYRELGYYTMNAEDFTFYGMFNYAYCVGLANNSYHHSFRPYQIMKGRKHYGDLIKGIEKKKCKTQGFQLLDYLEKFLNKKSDFPKISLVWQSTLLHDYMNNIFDKDDDLLNFYKRNEENLRNSFTILMGDHGYRMGKYASTDIGYYEHTNPYFIIILPVELRQNKELVENLKANANKHISHLDIYATLLDILTEGAKNNYTNLKPYDLSNVVREKIKGKSLLRPLPDVDRSCYEMYIPQQYCLCRLNYKYLPPTNVEIHNKLKEEFIRELNNKIIEGNLTDKCVEMSLDKGETFLVRKAQNSDGHSVYEVEAVTHPGKAMYRAMFNDKFKLVAGEITRLNTYKHQAEVCEKKKENKKFCYCRILLEKSKTTTSSSKSINKKMTTERKPLTTKTKTTIKRNQNKSITKT
uniref:Sulfatase domain-containing protein n=1 Tax=Parastrongyloides trichosuri TaxID=131310 RepID=A0A0N4ZVT8_PARTI